MSHVREMVVTVSSKVLESEVTREADAVRQTLVEALTAIVGGRGDIPAVETKTDTYAIWSKEAGTQYETRVLARAVLRV